jgi:hypothetical protein
MRRHSMLAEGQLCTTSGIHACESTHTLADAIDESWEEDTRPDTILLASTSFYDLIESVSTPTSSSNGSTTSRSEGK